MNLYYEVLCFPPKTLRKNILLNFKTSQIVTVNLRDSCSALIPEQSSSRLNLKSSSNIKIRRFNN